MCFTSIATTAQAASTNAYMLEHAPYTPVEAEAGRGAASSADLYGFLTTEPNAVVAPIHPKAMPVILTTDEEMDVWMKAPWSEAQQGCSAPSPMTC